MVQDNNKKRLGNRETLEILLRFIVLVLVVLEKTFCSLTSQLLKNIFSRISDHPYQSIVIAFLFISMAILKYFWAFDAILNPEKLPTSFHRTNGFPAK